MLNHVIDLDVLLLSRDASPLNPHVVNGLESQTGVCLHVYRVVGRRHDSDANRFETIARARNQAKRFGSSPWVMFLDDDVILHPTCASELVEQLATQTKWGALAADYLGQSDGKSNVHHVSMGATLFRRSVLEQVRFRWESGKCECRCCCEDLDKLGLRIGYLPTARATHISQGEKPTDKADDTRSDSARDPLIITAVDWRHAERFEQLFLRTLQATDNPIRIVVFGYGLNTQTTRRLAQHPLIADVVARDENGHCPGIRRCFDFQRMLAQMPAETPVAFWDAGDVLFQDRLDELWTAVRRHHDQLLVVQEPASHAVNPALENWTLRVSDLRWRHRILQLLRPQPFLNGGFAAGTVRSLQGYLHFAEQFLTECDLAIESTADQLALNYYCYSHEGSWRAIDEGWNYCLAFRRRPKLETRQPGDTDWHPLLKDIPRFVSHEGKRIPVVHGNGNTLESILKQWWSRG